MERKSFEISNKNLIFKINLFIRGANKILIGIDRPAYFWIYLDIIA